MIDHTKAKTNRDLLEAATSFKFRGYKYFDEQFGRTRDITLYLRQETIYNKSFWVITCSLGAYDRVEKRFGYHITHDYQNSMRFDDVYEAYKKIEDLIR